MVVRRGIGEEYLAIKSLLLACHEITGRDVSGIGGDTSAAESELCPRKGSSICVC